MIPLAYWPTKDTTLQKPPKKNDESYTRKTGKRVLEYFHQQVVTKKKNGPLHNRNIDTTALLLNANIPSAIYHKPWKLLFRDRSDGSDSRVTHKKI